MKAFNVIPPVVFAAGSLVLLEGASVQMASVAFLVGSLMMIVNVLSETE